MPGPPEQRAAGARTTEPNGAFLFGLGSGVLSSDDTGIGLGESHAVIVGRSGILPAASLDARIFSGSGGKGARSDSSSKPNTGRSAAKVGPAGVLATNLLSSNCSGTVQKSSE